MLGYDINKPCNQFNTDNEIKRNQNIISDDDLEMALRIFCMRKQELELVSYPDVVKDETLFYNCQTESGNINDDQIFNIQENKIENNPHTFSSINNKTLQVQNEVTTQIKSDKYEDSLQWCD